MTAPGATLAAESLEIRAGGRVLASGLDLALRPGESWVLLGRNGAGKSLLIETLAGLRAPAAGRVTLDGRALADWPRRALAARIGLLLQDEPSDFWGTLAEYVALGLYAKGAIDPAAPAVAAALARMELGAAARQRYRTLSGGERQRARLAQLVVQDPEVWLLDEPLNHLDLRHERLVMRLIGERAAAGRTVLATVHDPSLARAHFAHALLMYDSGRIEQGRTGATDALAAPVLTAERIAALYGLDAPFDAPPAGTHPDSTPR